jgi:anti-anti-sigma factor
MTMLARIEEQRLGDVAVAGVDGEIDASNTEWLGTRLRGLLTNRSSALIVDLTRTTYLDSAGIALLFELAAELRLHQQQLRLVLEPASPIARMAQLTGLDEAVASHGSLDAALRSIHPG